MCLRPFCDKVGEGLRLDCGSSDVYDVQPVEIKGPLSVAFERIPISDDLAKGASWTPPTQGVDRSSGSTSAWR